MPGAAAGFTRSQPVSRSGIAPWKFVKRRKLGIPAKASHGFHE
jgi:hypothetical protein